MSRDEGGFLSRWSRRKEAARSGQALPPEPLPEAEALKPTAAGPAPVTEAKAAAAPAPAQPSSPPPTLDDVASLTPESDFSRFVARDVPGDVRNAAVKKLFADPHFNVMDGLDVYIDDYSQPSPLSKADIAKMVGARFLKLVDDPDEATTQNTTEAAVPSVTTDGGPTAATPVDDVAAPHPPHDDHADLQLQPDHDPGRESPGHGAG
ncbi:DUF3306 domain-containing protein [Hydrogenophaga sp. XSHU_21]